jgi:Arc/MetJ-type ribon-helix-helix transcriptional regulator
MSTVSARLPNNLEAQLEEYVERETMDRSTAVRRLLADGLSEWRRDRAVELVREGEATVSRGGAELAKMDVWAFTDLLEEPRCYLGRRRGACTRPRRALSDGGATRLRRAPLIHLARVDRLDVALERVEPWLVPDPVYEKS